MTTRTAARTQFLTDIYVCALEGGIGYWSTCIEYRWSTTQRAVIEDLEDAVHEITLDTIARGINAVADGSAGVSDYLRNLIRAANRSNDAGDVDAIAADVIAQARHLRRGDLRITPERVGRAHHLRAGVRPSTASVLLNRMDTSPRSVTWAKALRSRPIDAPSCNSAGP